MNIAEQSSDFCIKYLSCIKRVAISLKLTQSQILCIYCIPFSGISQANLARKLTIDISTLSRNLNVLISKNLINKRASMIDKRSFKISLTSEGKNLCKTFNQEMFNHLKLIYKTLNIW